MTIISSDHKDEMKLFGNHLPMSMDTENDSPK